LFTRLDETDRLGALVSEAARRSLPISFLATGQQIPDDLEAASKELIADRVRGAHQRIRTLGATA
jgi:flagellar biosynthesis protein FlhF